MREDSPEYLTDSGSDAMPPYSSYRHSGVDCLGEVPAHWEVKRLGQIGNLFKGSGGTKDDAVSDGVPCVRYGDLYTHHDFFVRDAKSCVSEERAARYTAIRYGDVLFAGSGETIDEIGKSAVTLIRGPACCGGDVIVFRPHVQARAEFLGYATDCAHAANQKARMGRGFTVMHIYRSELKHLYVAVPPISEQVAIVRFLDHVDHRIRRYVRAKHKLIAVLEEQKQAVIQQAVTGRIDVRTGRPYTKYKPSGVEWLGQVPEHWRVAALRHRYSQCLGKMLDSKRITGSHSLPYLRNVDVQWDRINIKDLSVMDITPEEYERYTLRHGDLLVCEGGEMGRSALWSGELPRCGFQKALHRLRPRNAGQDAPRFMHYALRAAVNGNAFDDGHLSTIAHLTGEKLRTHRFPFPPAAEQESMVMFLDRELKQLDRSVSSVRRQIALLQEYRTRLIADVVTGKLDVREAAAGLPAVDALGAEDRLETLGVDATSESEGFGTTVEEVEA